MFFSEQQTKLNCTAFQSFCKGSHKIEKCRWRFKCWTLNTHQMLKPGSRDFHTWTVDTASLVRCWVTVSALSAAGLRTKKMISVYDRLCVTHPTHFLSVSLSLFLSAGTHSFVLSSVSYWPYEPALCLIVAFIFHLLLPVLLFSLLFPLTPSPWGSYTLSVMSCTDKHAACPWGQCYS